MKLSDIGEKAIISSVIRRNNIKSDGTLPLNDDAQILIPPKKNGHPLVIATDRTPSNLRPYVWGFYNLFEYGSYSVVSNLSDMAAMGAEPFGYLLNIAAPSDMLLNEFERVFSGVQATLRDYDTELLGGDTKQEDQLNLVGVAIGQSFCDSVLTRSGARPGDKLVMSNHPVGGIPAAHAYFSNFGPDVSGKLEKDLADEFHYLSARIDEAKLLAECGLCTSCIDNSDGLIASLDELSSASGVGFSLEKDALEIPSYVIDTAFKLRFDPTFLACGAGGDFRLIATVEKFDRRLAKKFVKIGEVSEKKTISIGGNILRSGDVSKWNHFKR
jgi:thiamine-monophosphate kinase